MAFVGSNDFRLLFFDEEPLVIVIQGLLANNGDILISSAGDSEAFGFWGVLESSAGEAVVSGGFTTSRPFRAIPFSN